MLGQVINHFSQLLGIEPNIIPNIITLLVVIVLFSIGLKGSLQWVSVLAIYSMAMIALTLLGIDSIFNIVTLLGRIFFYILKFNVQGVIINGF